MIASPLPKKLQIKSGQRGIILNAPESYLDELRPLPEDFTVADTLEGSDFDFVQVFVRSMEELQAQLPRVAQAVKPDAFLWIAYPKGSKKAGYDVNRDSLWEAAEQYNLTGVALVSLDEKWSAMRFRPSDQVVSKRHERALP